MNLYEAIRLRYSCRKFTEKPIEKEKLDRILEAARLAPSAKNLQDWRFIVVTDERLRNATAAAANNQTFIARAAAIIVGCSVSDYVMRCGQPVSGIDLAIAMEHIALAAVAEGLATCWIGSFDPDRIRSLLGIPENVSVVELMPVGYPVGRETRSKRNPIDKIVSCDRWRF
jgi:nitroreductase